MNANFAENQARLDILEAPVYYSGDIGSENTSNTYKTLGGTYQIYDGITKTNTTTLTVATKGIYRIHAQQLVTVGASSGYYAIRINNASTTYAYLIASRQIDMIVHELRELNVGDTVRVHQDVALTSSWAGAHSRLTLNLIKRT